MRIYVFFIQSWLWTTKKKLIEGQKEEEDKEDNMIYRKKITLEEISDVLEIKQIPTKSAFCTTPDKDYEITENEKSLPHFTTVETDPILWRQRRHCIVK